MKSVHFLSHLTVYIYVEEIIDIVQHENLVNNYTHMKTYL